LTKRPRTSLFSVIALMALAGVLPACGEKPSADSKQSKPDVAEGLPQAKSEESAAGEETPKAVTRLSLPASELHSQKALEGLGEAAPRAAPEESGKETGSSKPKLVQKRFTRVVGGDDSFCGSLTSGSVICWGKEKRGLEGGFIDVAVGASGVCGVDLGGAISCSDIKTPPQGRFSRIAAEGENYCALSRQGEVSCFGKKSSSPLKGMLAEFITVGANFACAADPTRKLICWGETAPLMLPIDSLRVKDIAAGATFLCTLNQEGRAKCFGQGPRLPEGVYAGINASYDEVCGVLVGGGGVCAKSGEKFEGSIRRFAVGKNSVCSHLTRNHLECRGATNHKQLSPPMGEADEGERPTAPGTVGAETWLDFLALFPRVEGQLTFGRKTALDLGGRLPPEFEPLVSGDPNELRTGVRFPLPSERVGITFFDLKKRELVLYVYAGRKRIESFALLRWSESPLGEVSEIESLREASGRESIVDAEGVIHITELTGKEVTRFVKRHQDGRRPVSSRDCKIGKVSWNAKFPKSGPSARVAATNGQEYGAVDKDGCGARFPFR